MAANYDATEFIDGDFQAHKASFGGSNAASSAERAPTREEVDSRVADAQQKLHELKRAQEELERERSALEETRRRQAEFHTGRQEMLQHLTRGLGLLEEGEFKARRDAEQMAKTVEAFREALSKIEGVHEESWTRDNFDTELTRALTVLENARMEWNGARLKFPVLAGETGQPPAPVPPQIGRTLLETHSFGELCRVGFALTWPVALAGLAALAGLLMVLSRR